MQNSRNSHCHRQKTYHNILNSYQNAPSQKLLHITWYYRSRFESTRRGHTLNLALIGVVYKLRYRFLYKKTFLVNFHHGEWWWYEYKYFHPYVVCSANVSVLCWEFIMKYKIEPSPGSNGHELTEKFASVFLPIFWRCWFWGRGATAAGSGRTEAQNKKYQERRYHPHTSGKSDEW